MTKTKTAMTVMPDPELADRVNSDTLTIDIDVRSDGWLRFVPEARVLCEQAIQQAWLHIDMGERPSEVSVVLTDDEFQRTLNRDYRGKDRSTNVLSFPGDDPQETHPDAPLILGDIVLALETVSEECKANDVTPRDHVTHLLVHGMLHLAGYDHENDDDAEEMESLEILVLSELGIANPYGAGAQRV